jgi:hypothetical protein
MGMFMPKGLSVRDRAMRISARRAFPSIPEAPIIPKPPARDTAAASSPRLMRRIAPWMMGYSAPRISVTRFFISPPGSYERCKNPDSADNEQDWILFKVNIIFFFPPSQPIKRGRKTGMPFI